MTGSVGGGTPMRHATHESSRSRRRPSASDFRSLGIRDLLDARDQFHVHLAHKPNVFSTAVGRYLVRDNDSDAPEAGDGPVDARARNAKARTLLNSKVKPWSWPCILVFVKRWETLDDLSAHPEDVVPPFIYMPDGRTPQPAARSLPVSGHG